MSFADKDLYLQKKYYRESLHISKAVLMIRV